MPGPLHGYRIIDLTSNVAGPLGTMILGDQGAEVIKVEAPEGDSTRAGEKGRGGFNASFLNNNRNKRSIVLNLKHPAALVAVKRLAATADVPGAIVSRHAAASNGMPSSPCPESSRARICAIKLGSPHSRKRNGLRTCA